MKRNDIELFSAAHLVAAFSMFPSLTPPVRRRAPQPAPYHREGRDAVLMDWDIPKGKRARRRSRMPITSQD